MKNRTSTHVYNSSPRALADCRQHDEGNVTHASCTVHYNSVNYQFSFSCYYERKNKMNNGHSISTNAVICSITDSSPC